MCSIPPPCALTTHCVALIDAAVLLESRAWFAGMGVSPVLETDGARKAVRVLQNMLLAGAGVCAALCGLHGAVPHTTSHIQDAAAEQRRTALNSM